MTRILVAEDDLEIGELIRLILEFGGSEVTSARNGTDALKLANRGNFDAVLLDVRMPGLSGLEVCRRLRAGENFRDIPIIFISARGQESEIHAGLNAGADAYVVKPFDPDDLTAMVFGLLAHSNRARLTKH
ncbi:MAG TPA: response regulator [candidate division Zixibacteria bacterium]|nr:response regulator [candidate division Zixibacteria bacterium]